MMSKFRWLLIAPVCIFSWYLMVFLGLSSVSVAMSLCPSEKMISGWCSAAWFSIVLNSLFVIFSGVSAAVIVTCAYFLAPEYKVKMAVVALLLGVLVATYSLYKTEAWLVYISAVLGGVLATYLVSRFDADRTS